MVVSPRALVGFGGLKTRRRACISEHPIPGVWSNVTGVTPSHIIHDRLRAYPMSLKLSHLGRLKVRNCHVFGSMVAIQGVIDRNHMPCKMIMYGLNLSWRPKDPSITTVQPA